MDRRLFFSPSQESSSMETSLSLLEHQQQQQQRQQQEQQHQQHVHQRLLSLLSPHDIHHQQPRQQQHQSTLDAQELLKNILLRGSTGSQAAAAAVTAMEEEARAHRHHHHMVPLPSKLYSLLGNKDVEHIISWLPQGRAWRIHNVDLFAQRLLPLFSNNNNMVGTSSSSSAANKNLRAFTSQLEAWGFRELSRGPNSLAYYSELFVREAPGIHQLMRPAAATATTQQSTSSSPIRSTGVHQSQDQQQLLGGQAAVIEPSCSNHQLLTLQQTPTSAAETTTIEALQALKAASTKQTTLNQRHHHHTGDLALLARAAAASNKAASSASATQQRTFGNPARSHNINNNMPMAATTHRPGPLMDVVVPRSEESLAQLELQMTEALRVAKELHDRSIMHLRQARRIADSTSCSSLIDNNSTIMSPLYAAPSNQRPNTKATAAGTHPHLSAHANMVSPNTVTATTLLQKKSTSASKKTSSSVAVGSTTVAGIQTVKKRHRKKWLPPLGPPTHSSSTGSLPLLPLSPSRSHPLSASSSSSNNININRRCSNTTSASGRSGATNAPTNTNMYDWYYTNPEVFATLSNKAQIQP